MKTDNLQYLHENATHRFYRSFYQNHEIIWSQDKQNPGEILINTDSLASMFGFESFQEMMSDDRMLDLFNEFMNSSGIKEPIKNMPW